MIQTLTDEVDSDFRPPTRTANTISQLPFLRVAVCISCQHIIHQNMSQPMLIVTISGLIPSAMITRKTSRTIKNWKRMTKKNPTVIARKKSRHYCVSQRNGPCLSLKISLRCNFVSNVAAFRRRFQTVRPRPRMNRTLAAIHFRDLIISQALKLLPLIRPTLSEIQVM